MELGTLLTMLRKEKGLLQERFSSGVGGNDGEKCRVCGGNECGEGRLTAI